MFPHLLPGCGREAVAGAVRRQVALDQVAAQAPRSRHAMPDHRPSSGYCPDEPFGLQEGDCPGQRVPVDSVVASEIRHARQLLHGSGGDSRWVYANDLFRQGRMRSRHIIESREHALIRAVAAPMALCSRVPASGVRLVMIGASPQQDLSRTSDDGGGVSAN